MATEKLWDMPYTRPTVRLKITWINAMFVRLPELGTASGETLVLLEPFLFAFERGSQSPLRLKARHPRENSGKNDTVRELIFWGRQ